MTVLNKTDIIRESANITGKSTSDVKRVIDAMLEVFENNLKIGNEVKLVGYFNLAIKKRKASIGRNPSTGEPLKIPAFNLTVAKVGSKLKKINN